MTNEYDKLKNCKSCTPLDLLENQKDKKEDIEGIDEEISSCISNSKLLEPLDEEISKNMTSEEENFLEGEYLSELDKEEIRINNVIFNSNIIHIKRNKKEDKKNNNKDNKKIIEDKVVKLKENISNGLEKGIDVIKKKSIYDIVNDVSPKLVNKLEEFADKKE